MTGAVGDAPLAAGPVDSEAEVKRVATLLLEALKRKEQTVATIVAEANAGTSDANDVCNRLSKATRRVTRASDVFLGILARERLSTTPPVPKRDPAVLSEPRSDDSVRVPRFEYARLCAIASAADAALGGKSVPDEGGVEHPLNVLLGALKAYQTVRIGETPLSLPMACSFCGKPRETVRQLIGGTASPSLICGGCITTSAAIIHDDEASIERQATAKSPARAKVSPPPFDVTIAGVGQRPGATEASEDDAWNGVGGPHDTGLLLQLGSVHVFVPAPEQMCRDLAAYMYGPPLKAQIVFSLPAEGPGISDSLVTANAKASL